MYALLIIGISLCSLLLSVSVIKWPKESRLQEVSEENSEEMS